MRVLSVSALVDPVNGGGTAERTLQLARAMARAGMDVRVLATDAGLGSSSRQPDVGTAKLDLLPLRNERFLVPKVRTGEIERHVREADVVHLCNHWTVLNLIVQRAAQRLGKPYLVCPAGGLPLFGRSKWLKRAYNALGGRSLVARAAGWVAITRRETADFAPYGVDPAKVDVIPNGIEPGDYLHGDPRTFRERFGLGGARIVLFVGRLNSIKGPDLLLEAFAALAAGVPAARLVYVGPDGGMQAALDARARQLGIAERVAFAGWLGGAAKVAAYRAAELVVVPSRQEAMSLVALEAGACGKPVLMSDRCGFDDAVASGGARAVPPTSDALARELADLVQHAPLAAMGERLRTLVTTAYTWDAAVNRYRSLFRRVTAAAASQ
jgi:glycosyltransferase involved in cell wall biosynthesis